MQIQVAPKMGVMGVARELATGVGAIHALESYCSLARLHRAARHLGRKANLLRMQQTVGRERSGPEGQS